MPVLSAVVAAGLIFCGPAWVASLVAILGAFGWGTFAASIFPVVAVGLNWKGATVPGAITAIIAALLINFVTQLGGYTLPYGISGQLIAFASSMVLFIGVSMLTKKPELASDIDQMMDI